MDVMNLLEMNNMRHLLIWLLILIASIATAQSQEKLRITTSHTFILNHPELKPIKGYVKFENGKEQYAIKIDSNYYFIRRVYLFPVKVNVKEWREIK